MPLRKSILTNSYQSFFDKVNKSDKIIPTNDCVNLILDTYHSYVQTGQDPSGDPVLTTQLPAAKSALITGLESNNGENAFKTAMSIYWTGATFNLLVPHTTMSQEISAMVTGFNVSRLNGVFSSEYDSSGDAASNLADKLDQFTKTVTILITGLAKTGSPPPVITASGRLS